MYHDPCHTPMKTMSPIKIATSLMGQPVELSDRCCGEAGTFAVSRPDIATQVRFRKQQEIESGATKICADGFDGNVKILTSCPSCLQGLQRYREDVSLEADYIVVEMAKRLLGKDWLANYVRAASNGGIERVLL
jgi:Fe-S oxidoreductase